MADNKGDEDMETDGAASAVTEGNGSASTTASPVETSSESTEPVATEASTNGEATVGGIQPEMSPPSTAPTATPVPAPINLLDTCAVCKQSLQSRDCEPKLLPCLHSFCLKCIPQPERQISVQVPGPLGQTDTHIVNVMRCLVCQQDYKQSDLIDNYFVKDTTEATSKSDEKASKVCTSCDDNAVPIAYCGDCVEWLCKTCVEAHQRVKVTKDHKIHTKEDIDSPSLSGQRPVFCPIHKKEPLKLFCETCDTLTCRDCQLQEHKEHRYQFLEEAFQNHKDVIETTMAKLQEKKNYVHYSVSQVQSRLKELNETHKKVEHEIKIAVFTLINEINKKGKSLLQQLESVTKERSMRLLAQHKDTTLLAQQIQHVLKFCQWAITTGSSTALLFSKRLVGNLVIEKPPPSVQGPGMVGPPGQGHPGKNPTQINLAQLRLQHMQQQQAAFAQKQQQHQHQQQIQQQMRIASHLSQQHPRQAVPPLVQQQPPRLINVQQLPRGPGGMNGGMYPSPHHMRLAGPSQGRMAAAQPRHNGQPFPPMMQPQLQRQHSNPGHAGPFPPGASMHNANPTSPTSASIAGPHSHRGPASPILGPIELIPTVTNPENLPSLPEIPPIQLEDAGSTSLGHLLSRYITASTQQHLGLEINPSPGISTHSPGSSGTNVHPILVISFIACFPECTDIEVLVFDTNVVEHLNLTALGFCMFSQMSSPENSDLPSIGPTSVGLDALRPLGERIKTEPQSELSCSGINGSTFCSYTTTTSLTTSKGKEDDPNEDWCAVCINGGDLLCCDRCPKVFHMKCHVPTIKIFPKGDFLCTFCRSLSKPEIEYCVDSKKINADEGLQPEDQRRCERVLLYVFCHELSVGFRDPVPFSVPNYYKIIKQPMDLKKVKKKLQLRSSQFYRSTLEFVSDMRLVFKNCAKYNEMSRIIQVYDEEKQINLQAGSEMAVSGQAVSLIFEEKLKEMFPGQDFPESPEPQSGDEKVKDDEETEDSDDEVVQPRRKRLKMDEKLVHIK
uniref:RING-type E3 ubiquitin transferase n=1 Tax=Gouania willdenowi TaxID=441366 RepID=A0A8C5H6Z2_GOUWI